MGCWGEGAWAGVWKAQTRLLYLDSIVYDFLPNDVRSASSGSQVEDSALEVLLQCGHIFDGRVLRCHPFPYLWIILQEMRSFCRVTVK